MSALDQINTRRLLNHTRDQITKCLMPVIRDIEYENNPHILTDIIDVGLGIPEQLMEHFRPEYSNVVQIYPNKYSKADKGYLISYLLSNGRVKTKLVKNRGLRIVKQQERKLRSLLVIDISVTPATVSEPIMINMEVEKL